MDHWRDRTVLVTGAAGLLGGHLVAALLDRGTRVLVLVRDHLPDCMLARDGLLERCVQVRGDLACLADAERAAQQHEVDSVFHLAAQAIVGTAKRSPWQTFEDNVRATWNVLEAARRCPGIGSIVVASSDKAYGPTARLPYTEDHALAGLSPYDASKAMADLCARSFQATYGLPLVTLRCGNLYGPGDLHMSRLIPELIRARLRGARPVIRSDGRARRDYLFVRDAVDAYLRAGQRASDPGVRGEAFNVSTGRPYEVMQVAALIDEAIGISEPPHEILGTAVGEGEIHDQTLDCTKAARLLGWTAQTDLPAGLAATIPWYRAALRA